MIDKLMMLIVPDGMIKGSKYYNGIIRYLVKYLIPLGYKVSKRSVVLGNINSKTNQEVVISLTSYGERVYQLHWCLESLFRQSISPTRIVLWLADTEYSESTIPSNLKPFIKLGLEVRFCEDLRSHKKYFGSINLWPDAIIVTVDDDVFYPEKMLENLLESYYSHPSCISCYRAHSIKVDNDSVSPYLNWGFASPGIKGPSHNLVAVGVGGVLYPPSSLSSQVLDLDVFKEHCFYADDLWLKIMGYMRDSKVVKVSPYSKTLFSVQQSSEETLSQQNVLLGRNDIQLRALMNYYKIPGSVFLRDQK